MDPLKMYSLLNTGIFHCHVSLLEGSQNGSFPCQVGVKITNIWSHQVEIARFNPAPAGRVTKRPFAKAAFAFAMRW